MTIAVTLERVAQIESMLSPAAPPTSSNAATSSSSSPTAVAANASGASAFANVLQNALGPNTSLASSSLPASGTTSPNGTSQLAGALGGLGGTLAGPGAVGGAAAPLGGGAAAMVALAQGEVGQAEMPPGSNDSPRIAMYRQATAGSGVGPWCAYFTSWLARSAGEPLGDQGQGFGSVDQLYSWAQHAGRAVPNGQGYVPKPGDLIVFNEHVGMVESTLPNGQIQTIEGNSSDRVSRNVRGANEAIGYVRMS
jgi:hypothetical protein